MIDPFARKRVVVESLRQGLVVGEHGDRFAYKFVQFFCRGPQIAHGENRGQSGGWS